MEEITMKLKTITAHATNPQMPIQTYRFDTLEEAEAPYDVQLNTHYLIRGTWYKEEDITKYHKKGLVEWMLFIESEEQSEKLRANILMWFPWLEKAIDALSKHIDKHPKLYKKAK